MHPYSFISSFALILLLGLSANLNAASRTAIGVLGYFAGSQDGGCAASFSDISISGTAISGTGAGGSLGDDEEANITLPFMFTYFGETSNKLRIGNNGGVLFNDTSKNIVASNVSIPVPAENGAGIYPYWDDIAATSGQVYTYSYTLGPGRGVFIVQWHQRPHFAVPSNQATFQMWLYEETGDIDFVYHDVDFGDTDYNNGVSATVGLDAVDDSTGIQSSRISDFTVAPAPQFSSSGMDYYECYRPKFFELVVIPELESDPNNCSIVDGKPTEITVNEGEAVRMCYSLTNQTGSTYTNHTLMNSVFDGGTLTFNNPIASNSALNLGTGFIFTPTTTQTITTTLQTINPGAEISLGTDVTINVIPDDFLLSIIPAIIGGIKR